MTFLDNKDPDICTYLENEMGHEKLACCHFNSKRYSMITSNNAESMNVIDKKKLGTTTSSPQFSF